MPVNSDGSVFERFSCISRRQRPYNNFGTSIQPRRWYQHDIDLIVYSSAFRKLQRKYQLLSDKDPRCRSRLIHTLEVSRVAKEIGEKLRLNTELIEAIALGHDLANTAFGAPSNRFLEIKTNGMFKHEEAATLIAKIISQKMLKDDIKNDAVAMLRENGRSSYGRMLLSDYPDNFEVYQKRGVCYYTSICDEVIDGIEKHGTNVQSHTLEGQVVNFSDNITYLSQDVDDLISTGIWSEDDINEFESLFIGLSRNADRPCELPNELAGAFSRSSSTRIGSLINYYISSNISLYEQNQLDSMHSEILLTEIPVLLCDESLQYIINNCWDFISIYYDNPLIKIASNIYQTEMDALWAILSVDDFINNNSSYIKFIKRYDLPIFDQYRREKHISGVDWELWKRAFFICCLSADEIRLIIDLYQQRDYTFELNL